MTDRVLGRESSRLQAIDVVRGFVMVLMTLDHSSSSLNAGRIVSEVMVGGEAVNGPLDPGRTLSAATMSGGQIGPILYLYPFLPWTGFMMLGWALGVRLARPDPNRSIAVRARDWLALAGIGVATFAIVRGWNGYGNAHLLRGDGS